jgi:hypothetical protein
MSGAGGVSERGCLTARKAKPIWRSVLVGSDFFGMFAPLFEVGIAAAEKNRAIAEFGICAF